MANVRDYLKEVPGVTWEYAKSEWGTDRVVIGPFTTPKLDKQRDRVLLTKQRLEYLFKYGNLIWNHHGDPREPVIVLGDCLAIGFDKSGKLYGAWGVKDGTETMDSKWGEIVKFGKRGGFSIGGTIPTGARTCTGSGCVLNDPEVLEVSFTTSPANDEAMVYYVNQFAKSMVDEGPNTFEIESEMRKFEAKVLPMMRALPDDNYEVDRFTKYPCVDSILQGYMEGGLKKDEAKLIVQTRIESLHKSVTGDDTVTEKQEPVEPAKVEKEMAPAPQQPKPAGGNETLEILNSILSELRILNAKHDADAKMSQPPAEPPVGGGSGEGKPPVEGGKSPEPPEAGKEKEGDEKDKKEDKKEKAEKSSPSNPLVQTTTEGMGEISKEKADGATGHTPDPKGSGSPVVGGTANPDLTPKPTEKPVPGDSKTTVGSDIPTGAPQGSPIKKEDMVVKRPEKGDVLSLLKEQGHVLIKVDTRAPVVAKDRVTGMPMKGNDKVTPGAKTPSQILREHANAPLGRMSKIQTKEV